MRSARIRSVLLHAALPLAGLTWPVATWAGSGRLGGGSASDVSYARILAALIICVIVAILAALLIRQRAGKIDLRALFGRMDLRARAIDIVETRRLSQHADISLIRYNGSEYLLLLQAGNAKVLSERPAPPASEDGATA